MYVCTPNTINSELMIDSLLFRILRFVPLVNKVFEMKIMWEKIKTNYIFSGQFSLYQMGKI